MPQVYVDDIAVHELDTGTGKPIVLWLHGYTMDGSIWEEAWGELPEFAHVAPDLPGHGVSRQFTESESLSSISASVEKVAREFNARHVVSISFGGTVGLQLGIDVKDFFQTLIVCSPGIAGGPVDLESQACNRELAQMYAQNGAGPWMASRWLQSPPEIFSGLRVRPRMFDKATDIINRHSWHELENGVMSRISQSKQSKAELGNINIPTLVLVGENDMESFKRTAEIIRRSVPNANRQYLPGVGHLGLLESPESQARVIREFISNVTADV